MNANLMSQLIFIGGVLHLGITSAGFTSVFVLDWKRNLAGLHALTRHIIWTHGAFVLMTIIGFGTISLACSHTLASGTPLARAVCGFIAVFWASRLMVGAFVFDAKPHLANATLKVCYSALNCVFVYFVICYSAAALS